MEWMDIESSGDLEQEKLLKWAHRGVSSLTIAHNTTVMCAGCC